jgi:hypothetical protein
MFQITFTPFWYPHNGPRPTEGFGSVDTFTVTDRAALLDELDGYGVSPLGASRLSGSYETCGGLIEWAAL